MNVNTYQSNAPRLTRVAKAFMSALADFPTPIATDYQLFLLLTKIYKSGAGLYLKTELPTISDYRRNRRLLIRNNVISPDEDYPSAQRILSKQDLPADEIACIVDPFCYISHLSAMQRYGLTDRRPEALHLTTPSVEVAKNLIFEKLKLDYGTNVDNPDQSNVYPLKNIRHPDFARKRQISVFKSKYFGSSITVKGSYARVSTIGQTFVDMLDEPERCGGMPHIIDVWKEYAKTYLEDIIASVNKAPKTIQKVRAGYILDEILGIYNAEIEDWQKYAQRGGSRVLDTTKPFKNNYSEKWMISINV